MKFFILTFGIVFTAFNFSFAQQQGNLKMVNPQQPSKISNININPNAESAGRGGLDMPGWQFVRPPRPNDQTSESGKIVFEISVSKEGNIIACTALESSVSNDLTKLYRDSVLKSKLKPTNPDIKPDSGATGSVTFIISVR